MKVLLNFDFDFDAMRSLKVCIEYFEQKSNLYCAPTEEIHEFDIANIFYDYESERLELFEDILREAIWLLEGMLRRALKGELELKGVFQIGQVGKAFNEFLVKGNEDAAYELLFSYALSSSKKCKLLGSVDFSS